MKIVVIFFWILSVKSAFHQKVVRYDLIITDTVVNFSGKEKRAIAVNGQIPMPTLTFTEGDIAEIVVHNKLKESTFLHWPVASFGIVFGLAGLALIFIPCFSIYNFKNDK